MTIQDIKLDEIDAVIFDLDGTLYDKSGLAKRLIASQLGLCRLSLFARERIARRNLKGKYWGSEEEFWKQFYYTMVFGNTHNTKLCRLWYNKDYMPAMIRTLDKYYKVREWVSPLWNDLTSAGKKIAVFSDYGEVEAKMKALGIDTKMVDVLVSASELGGLKPAKECIMQVIDKLGVTPERCLMVGDRDDTDGASARSVGAQFLLIEKC